MKTILLTLGASSLLFLGSSCHTMVPIDPNTGNRSCDMLPRKPCCPAFDCAPCTCKTEVKPSK